MCAGLLIGQERPGSFWDYVEAATVEAVAALMAARGAR
jgi:hypothetical protein